MEGLGDGKTGGIRRGGAGRWEDWRALEGEGLGEGKTGRY